MRSYWLPVTSVTIFMAVANAAAPPLSFNAPKGFPLPQGSGPAVLGDFNGDGFSDLAVDSPAGNGFAVTVFLGNGDGTFQPGIASPIPGPSGGGIVTGDFNGDGKLDLALSYCVPDSNCVSGGGIAILLGKGDGSFEAAKLSRSGNAPPNFMLVADFNGDGKPDVAAFVNPDALGNIVLILLGNGDGTLQPPSPVSVTYNPNYTYLQMVVGDFNGDGKPDLAVAAIPDAETSIKGGVFVLLGNGNGTFQPQLSAGFPEPTSLAAADFNNDGKLDLAVGVASGVSILLGKGNGSFQSPKTFPAQGTVAGVGDFNGDGNQDVVLRGYTTVFVMLGNGDGSLAKGESYSVGALSFKLMVGDINGDGNLDFAIQDDLYLETGERIVDGAGVAIMLGDGQGHFQHVRLSSDSGDSISPLAIAVADFNGDGKPDVAATGSNYPVDRGGAISIWLGNGDGTFTPLPSPYGLLGNGIAAGDFNGDGKQDLVVVTDSVNILLGNGDGSFQSPVSYTLPIGGSTVTVADLNGDGKLDLVVTPMSVGTNVPKTVFVLLGKGDGTFGAASQVTVGNAPASVAVADFNGDGIPDLAVVVTPTGEPGAVAILLGKGDGTFQPPAMYAAGKHPVFVAAADFNLDGKADLVVTNLSEGNPAGGPASVIILLGKGDGTFGGPASYPAGAGAVLSAVVADFNGDGKPDLAVPGSALSILLGKGDGAFEPPKSYSPQLAGVLAVGDFNGDGQPDLIQGPLARTFAILLNTTK